MESDRHPHGHPRDISPLAPLPTLPSVAEILAASRPSSDTIPAYYQTNDPLRSAPIRQPLPRGTPPAMAASTTPFIADRPSFVAINHASQASPMESQRLPYSSEQRHHPNPRSRTSPAPVTPGSTTEAYPSLQDPTQTQSPTNARRQDSAVTQQHLFKGTETVTPVPEPNPSYFSQTPRHARQSTSPAISSYPTTPLSSLPPATAAHLNSPDAHAIGHGAQRNHATSPTTETFVTTDNSSLRDQPTEVVSSPSTSVDYARNSMVPPLPPDANAQTKQQRFNVRFAANHTPDNMSSTQRPRHDAPFTSPPITEGNGVQAMPREQPVVPGSELAIQAPNHSAQRPGEHANAQIRIRERENTMSSKCECGHVWTRPLPSSPLRSDDAQAQTTYEMARANLDWIMNLEYHGKEADASLIKWQKDHANCARTNNGMHSPRPQNPPPVEYPHSKPHDSASPNDPSVGTIQNKRKSDLSHSEESSKLRRVAFEPTTMTTPQPRPSSLA